jgi:hypothetical protein
LTDQTGSKSASSPSPAMSVFAVVFEKMAEGADHPFEKAYCRNLASKARDMASGADLR